MDQDFKLWKHACLALFLALLGLSMLMPYQAKAHNLWLNATDFTPELSRRAGAHTKIYFGFGHRFPVADFLGRAKLREFRLVDSAGGEISLDASEGGFLATPVVMKKAGPYTVAAATKTGFYTMYKKGGRARHKLATMEGLENVILSVYFENYTKALLNVGEPLEESFTSPVGHNIEIVPLENPYGKRVGDRFKVKVLFEGEPVPYAMINATYVGFSDKEEYAFTSKANGKGIAEIKLLASGQWTAISVLRKPPTAELRGKCLERKYSATLSWGVE